MNSDNNIKQPLSAFEIMKQNDSNSDSKIDKLKNFIFKKRIYFIGFFILLLLIIIIIVVSTGGKKDSESNSEKEQGEEKNEPFSKHYSQKNQKFYEFYYLFRKR